MQKHPSMLFVLTYIIPESFSLKKLTACLIMGKAARWQVDQSKKWRSQLTGKTLFIFSEIPSSAKIA